MKLTVIDSLAQLYQSIDTFKSRIAPAAALFIPFALFALLEIALKLTKNLVLCALITVGLHAAHAQESDTLKKIRETKTASIGVRDSAAPLSYATGNGAYAGYHVDICRQVLEELVPGVKISYVSVTSTNRIPLVQNGTTVMECGSTTNTDARQKDVAFSLTTFVAEIRMAVKKSSGIQSVAQLEGKTAVSTSGGTGLTMLRKIQKTQNLKFDVLAGRDHAESFLLLESGRADAFVLDDNVIAGLIALSAQPQDYILVGEPMSADPNAVMLPKNDPAFKAAVDGVMARMMRSGEMAALYDKWFMKPIPPRNVTVGLSMSSTLRRLFKEPNDFSAEKLAQ